MASQIDRLDFLLRSIPTASSIGCDSLFDVLIFAFLMKRVGKVLDLCKKREKHSTASSNLHTMIRGASEISQMLATAGESYKAATF
jgi:hypothetical protein